MPTQDPSFSDAFIAEVNAIWKSLAPGDEGALAPLIMLALLEDATPEQGGFAAAIKVQGSEQNNGAEVLIRTFKLLINQVARFLYHLAPQEDGGSQSSYDRHVCATIIEMVLREFDVNVAPHTVLDFVSEVLKDRKPSAIILTDN